MRRTVEEAIRTQSEAQHETRRRGVREGAKVLVEMRLVKIAGALGDIRPAHLGPCHFCSYRNIKADDARIGLWGYAHPPGELSAKLSRGQVRCPCEIVDSNGASGAQQSCRCRGNRVRFALRYALQQIFFHHRDAPGERRLGTKAVIEPPGRSGPPETFSAQCSVGQLNHWYAEERVQRCGRKLHGE